MPRHLYKIKLDQLYLKIETTKAFENFNFHSSMDFIYKTRGEFLKILRIYKKGLSTYEFSLNTDFTPEEILRVEDGKAFLPTSILLELCEELGASNEILILYAKIKEIIEVNCSTKDKVLAFEKKLLSGGIHFPQFKASNMSFG